MGRGWRPDAIQALSASLAGLKGYFWKHIGAEDAEDMFHDLIVVLVKQVQNGSLEDPERLPGYVRGIAQRRIAAQIGLRMRARRPCSVDDVEFSELDARKTGAGHPPQRGREPAVAHRWAWLRQQPETIETVVADTELFEPSNEEEWLKRRRQTEI
jgi:hypothetical protein